VPSMAFALPKQARLLLVPPDGRTGTTTLQASLDVADWPVATAFMRCRRSASTAGSRPSPGASYRGPWRLPGPDLHRLAALSLSLGYTMSTSSSSWRPSCWTHLGNAGMPRRTGCIRSVSVVDSPVSTPRTERPRTLNPRTQAPTGTGTYRMGSPTLLACRGARSGGDSLDSLGCSSGVRRAAGSVWRGGDHDYDPSGGGDHDDPSGGDHRSRFALRGLCGDSGSNGKAAGTGDAHGRAPHRHKRDRPGKPHLPVYRTPG